jgi:uncharacterized protein
MSDKEKVIPTLDYLRQHREAVLELASAYGAYNVRVFGSVARGESDENSDIDLLMAFEDSTSLFELSALWQDLQGLLGIAVNIVSEGGLKDHFKSDIEKDLVTL